MRDAYKNSIVDTEREDNHLVKMNLTVNTYTLFPMRWTPLQNIRE
jgi:hypothetical protein